MLYVEGQRQLDANLYTMYICTTSRYTYIHMCTYTSLSLHIHIYIYICNGGGLNWSAAGRDEAKVHRRHYMCIYIYMHTYNLKLLVILMSCYYDLYCY